MTPADEGLPVLGFAYPPASTATVPDDLAIALDAAPGARAFFDTLTGANRYAVLLRIHEAKRPATRIVASVAMCVAGETIYATPHPSPTVTTR